MSTTTVSSVKDIALLVAQFGFSASDISKAMKDAEVKAAKKNAKQNSEEMQKVRATVESVLTEYPDLTQFDAEYLIVSRLNPAPGKISRCFRMVKAARKSFLAR